MVREQDIFWEEIQKIQDYVVNISITKISEYKDINKLLNDVTYDTIYGLMELLDGHRNNALRGEIRSMITGNIINANMELHNYCEDYLKCSDV